MRLSSPEWPVELRPEVVTLGEPLVRSASEPRAWTT
jgi:hypothetical protein